MAEPAPAGDGGSERAPRPHYEVADVVRAYGRAFTVTHRLSAQQRRVLRAIAQCRTAAATLQRFAADPTHRGAELGITAVLHTWGQTLTEHVHLHCVVTGGGLSPEGRWVDLPKGRPNRLFLFPVRALSKLFRAKFCEGLQPLHAQGKLRLWGPCAPLSGRVEWARYLHTLTSSPWVVYAKPPFGGPAVVLKYLSRYTHRVAITNQRLVSIGGGLVRLRYHDYADHNAAKILTLSAEEFLRRFLLHVLPLGFKRIRHFGRLASRGRAAKLQRCRHLLGQHPSAALSAPPDPATKPAALEDPAAGTTTPRCPICGSQRRRIIERRPPIRPGPLLL